MLRVCVIGMGPIGRRHADLLQADGLAELVGVCDRLRERADAAAERLGVPAFYEAGAMLRALAPAVAHITTGGVEYGSDHYEPTMQALEAGCHVLGEKPISNVVEEAAEMVARARELGLCYGINLNHRFTPAARLARRWAMIRLTEVAMLNDGTPIFCRRVSVSGALLVCSVDITMWPVWAALMAMLAVSRSRISPTMMMSGS